MNWILGGEREWNGWMRELKRERQEWDEGEKGEEEGR